MFAIDICKISDEYELGYKEPIVVEDFLANYHDIFPNELQGMPPQREVDDAIELVPSVTRIARAPCVLVFPFFGAK